MHGLTPAEQTEIVAVAAEWKQVDRSHRKLAHRGSYLGRFWASPSTVRRVLAAHDVDLPAAKPVAPLPTDVTWEPNNIWIYGVTHFTRAAVAIEDVVSRKWLTTVLSAEETSTQVEIAFTQALEQEGVMDAIAARLDGTIAPDGDDGAHKPVLLAWSDNGPQMTSADTKAFMALHLIARHHGRPHTPTDQAWIETLFGHLKGEQPYLTAITDPADLWHELEAARHFYNHVRLHAGIGYVTPDDEHHGRGPAIRAARRAGLRKARTDRIDYHRTQRAGRPPDAA